MRICVYEWVCAYVRERKDERMIKRANIRRSAARFVLEHLCAKETSFEWKKEKLKRVNYISRVLRNLYNKHSFPLFLKISAQTERVANEM